jgi:uncharacterized phage-associated protein
MRLVFNEEKATQAAAYLLKKFGGQQNYMKLIKMLYLADRKALLETGYTITGDLMFSLPQGPVLSRIYNLIAEESETPTRWLQCVKRVAPYEVAIDCDPGADELSDYETGVLDAIYVAFGAVDKWALNRETHNLPEWRDPGTSSIPIDPSEILRLEGVDAAEIRRIVEEAEERWQMHFIEPADSQSS